MKDTGERLIPELHIQGLTYGEHLSRYIAMTDLVTNKTVLDIACGVGYGSQLLAKTAANVIGVDISKEAIEYAKKKYPAKNLKYVVGDAYKLPLDDKSIDVVVSLETIEHLDKPELFVKEVKRLLRPDGQFVVSTPNDAEFIDNNDFHVHEFNLEELRKLTAKYFKNSHYYYQGSWFGTGILTKKSFDERGDLDAKLVKTLKQPANKAIYFIAVCSDNTPASLNQNIVIADIYSAKLEIENAEQHKKHIKELDAKVAELQQGLEKEHNSNQTLIQELNGVKSELGGIKDSRAWKVLNLYKKAGGSKKKKK